MKTPYKDWPTRQAVREKLFYLWVAMFLFYTLLMFGLRYKVGVVDSQCDEATWKIAYLFVPVLGVIFSYFFADKSTDEKRRIDPFRPC